MKKNISYTLLRAWHAVGVFTTAMALIYLSATFPWGKGCYIFLMSDSFLKNLLGLFMTCVFFVPLVRTGAAFVWLIIPPLRDNGLLVSLACTSTAVSESTEALKTFKKKMYAQYVMMAVFLFSTDIALLFSIRIALGDSRLAIFNYSSLLLGIVVTVLGIMLQLYMRSLRLRESRILRQAMFAGQQPGKGGRNCERTLE